MSNVVNLLKIKLAFPIMGQQVMRYYPPAASRGLLPKHGKTCDDMLSICLESGILLYKIRAAVSTLCSETSLLSSRGYEA